jgi:hypothetical protein
MRHLRHPIIHRLLILSLGVIIGLGVVRADGGRGDDHHGNMRRATSPASADLAPAAAPPAVPGGPGYVMLAASDFKPDSDQDQYFRYWGGNSIEPASGSSGIGISAAVHLPQGAHITKITTYYFDSDPNSAPLFDLYRGVADTQELLGNLSSALPQDSFAGGEDVRSAAVSGAAAVVDNSRYSYMVIATLNRDPATPARTQRLHSLRVDYDFPVALPTVLR